MVYMSLYGLIPIALQSSADETQVCNVCYHSTSLILANIQKSGNFKIFVLIPPFCIFFKLLTKPRIRFERLPIRITHANLQCVPGESILS